MQIGSTGLAGSTLVEDSMGLQRGTSLEDDEDDDEDDDEEELRS